MDQNQSKNGPIFILWTKKYHGFAGKYSYIAIPNLDEEPHLGGGRKLPSLAKERSQKLGREGANPPTPHVS